MQKKLGQDDFSRAISMEGVQRTMGAQLQERLKLIATGQPIPEEAPEVEEAAPVEEEKVAEEEAATDASEPEEQVEAVAAPADEETIEEEQIAEEETEE
jgi:hypothetical protein